MLDVVKHEETEQSYPQDAWSGGRATWVHLGEASVSLAVPFLNRGSVDGDQFTDSIIRCRLPCLMVLENLIWMRTQDIRKAYTKSALGVTQPQKKWKRSPSKSLRLELFPWR